MEIVHRKSCNPDHSEPAKTARRTMSRARDAILQDSRQPSTGQSGLREKDVTRGFLFRRAPDETPSANIRGLHPGNVLASAPAHCVSPATLRCAPWWSLHKQ